MRGGYRDGGILDCRAVSSGENGAGCDVVGGIILQKNNEYGR